jgi:hypothetical protein
MRITPDCHYRRAMQAFTVAAKLLHARKLLDVAVIEPSSKHYYQPAWTLVGSESLMFTK